jgi:hypothetical protein
MALICAVALGACGGSSSSEHAAATTTATTTSTTAAVRQYPAVNRNNFMSSCVRSATAHLQKSTATQYCGRALECVEQRLPLSQFAATEQRLLAGQSNPGARILINCAKAAARSLGVTVATA